MGRRGELTQCPFPWLRNGKEGFESSHFISDLLHFLFHQFLEPRGAAEEGWERVAL